MKNLLKDSLKFLFSEQELALFILLLAESLLSSTLSEDAELLRAKKQLLTEEFEESLPLEDYILSSRKNLTSQRIPQLTTVLPFIEDDITTHSIFTEMPERSLQKVKELYRGLSPTGKKNSLEAFKTRLTRTPLSKDSTKIKIDTSITNVDLFSALLDPTEDSSLFDRYKSAKEFSKSPYYALFDERELESSKISVPAFHPQVSVAGELPLFSQSEQQIKREVLLMEVIAASFVQAISIPPINTTPIEDIVPDLDIFTFDEAENYESLIPEISKRVDIEDTEDIEFVEEESLYLPEYIEIENYKKDIYKASERKDKQPRKNLDLQKEIVSDTFFEDLLVEGSELMDLDENLTDSSRLLREGLRTLSPEPTVYKVPFLAKIVPEDEYLLLKSVEYMGKKTDLNRLPNPDYLDIATPETVFTSTQMSSILSSTGPSTISNIPITSRDPKKTYKGIAGVAAEKEVVIGESKREVVIPFGISKQQTREILKLANSRVEAKLFQTAINTGRVGGVDIVDVGTSGLTKKDLLDNSNKEARKLLNDKVEKAQVSTLSSLSKEDLASAVNINQLEDIKKGIPKKPSPEEQLLATEISDIQEIVEKNPQLSYDQAVDENFEDRPRAKLQYEEEIQERATKKQTVNATAVLSDGSEEGVIESRLAMVEKKIERLAGNE